MDARFDAPPRTRLVYGRGAAARLGELARELGAERVLLVTDAGLVAAGHVERAEQQLRAAGCTLARFAETHENPSGADVDACARAAREFQPALFVGLGGGSAIDVAKGAGMLLANGGRMQDYRGFGKTRAPLRPLIAVPTTAGTGSEVQSYALIADEDTHEKMACGAADAAPRVALLDPELTLSMPRFVTACTGLDAVGHVLETAVSTARNGFSSLYSHGAWRLVARAFPRVLAQPADLAARAAMLQAAAFAGLAIEHSMLGAAHSLANPLTARYGIAHGLAVALLLPHVVRYNAEEPAARAIYAELAASAGLARHGDDPARAVESLIALLFSFLEAAGVPRSIAAHGARPADLPALAEEASRQWTACFNPRPVAVPALQALLSTALLA